MSEQKVVVIGLDGADWRVLQPEIEAGRLPTLAKLQKEGSWGRLNSTIRPESSVAWSTFATGVNPGKHGVFGFVRQQQPTQFRLADATDVAVPRFWEQLGNAGRRVGLLNVPFTYPPQPVQGFVVSGMLTPGTHVPFTYPPALQEGLLRRFRPLLFDAEDGGGGETAVFERVTRFTEQQLAVATHLLDAEAWDCFVMVFTGLDRLQHFRWQDEAHRRHLRQLDDALGQLLEQLPKDVTLFLLSDHGFAGVANKFLINRWLQQEGYLQLKPAASPRLTMQTVSTWLKQIPLARWLKRRLLPAAWGPSQLKTAAFGQQIDWSQTQAYYAPDGGIRFNQVGREPQGILSVEACAALSETVRDKLLALRDPRTGIAPIASVHPKSSLYSGAFAEAAPDLIVEPQREATEPEGNYILDGKLDGETAVFVSSAPYQGNHAAQGIFLAWQPERIVAQQLGDLHLQDIAPTVLATLETPIPSYMDGRVLEELYLPEKRPTAVFVESDLAPAPSQPTPAADLTTIEDRLRQLGYLD